MTGRPPSGRLQFKRSNGKDYARAISGDPYFGHICPDCSGPKTDQAIRCRRCFTEARIVKHGNYRAGSTRGYTGARIINYHGPGT